MVIIKTQETMQYDSSSEDQPNQSQIITAFIFRIFRLHFFAK